MMPKKTPRGPKPRHYRYARQPHAPYMYPFTKTELRQRMKQLNEPWRLEANDCQRSPVSKAKAELLHEARGY